MLDLIPEGRRTLRALPLVAAAAALAALMLAAIPGWLKASVAALVVVEALRGWRVGHQAPRRLLLAADGTARWFLGDTERSGRLLALRGFGPLVILSLAADRGGPREAFAILVRSPELRRRLRALAGAG
ncbi:MAG: hypothetical protein RML12_07015 [Xanthomonadales bacterium]|nr:hypothetical protein [Xanthomonadales bacterium]